MDVAAKMDGNIDGQSWTVKEAGWGGGEVREREGRLGKTVI